jgi:hypothetical protein
MILQAKVVVLWFPRSGMGTNTNSENQTRRRLRISSISPKPGLAISGDTALYLPYTIEQLFLPRQ